MNYLKECLLIVGLILRLMCFIVLIYQAWNLTVDYLRFPSNVKLEDINDYNYYKLPAIQVCTENDFIFNRNKIDSKFDIFRAFEMNFNKSAKQYMEEICKFDNICDKTAKDEQLKLFKFIYEQTFVSELYKNYSQIFKNNVLELTINSNDFIECKVHFESDSGIKFVKSCEEYSPIIESLHGEEFGICFSYFNDKHLSKNNELILKDKDYIEFRINSSNIKNILLVQRRDMELNLFYLIYNSNEFKIPRVKNSIKTSAFKRLTNIQNILNPLEIWNLWFTNELSYTKTIVNHLSWPYSSHCQDFKSKIKSFTYLIKYVCNLRIVEST